jgi:hypothetical protein
MYAWSDEHEGRQLDYERFRKLTMYGYSISSEYSAQEALYVVNTDPFGRAYYEKPVGEIVKTEQMSNREFLVQGWSVKEFIVDNKIQLINKVSADLLVGEAPDITIAEDAADDMKEFLEKVEKENRFGTTLVEGAIKASSLGEMFIEPTIRDGKIKIKYVAPDFVDVRFSLEGDVEAFVYAWEIENAYTGDKRIDRMLKRTYKETPDARRTRLLRVKEFYKGRIEHSLYVIRNNQISEPVDMVAVEPVLWESASSLSEKRFVFKREIVEGVSDLELGTIVEYTGIDEFMFIHWPNYKLMGWYGQSDNGMIESLQNALNSRETQLNDVLDKHADPAMAGPRAFQDERGNVKMSEGGGNFFGIDKDELIPQYLTWDGHIAEVHEELKRLYKAICDNTEVAMALTGMDVGGIESGRALMYKLIRSLAMKARKARYLEAVLQELYRTLQKMKAQFIDGGIDKMDFANEEYPNNLAEVWDGKIWDVEIEFKENLPADVGENLRDIGFLVSTGLLSTETALKIVAKYLDEVAPDEEIKRIRDEKAKVLVDQWAALNTGGRPVTPSGEREPGAISGTGTEE